MSDLISKRDTRTCKEVVRVPVEAETGTNVELSVRSELIGEAAVQVVLGSNLGIERTVRKECEPLSVRPELAGETVVHRQGLGDFKERMLPSTGSCSSPVPVKAGRSTTPNILFP